MVVLFVHGLGRTPLSGWPMLRQLRRAGLSTSVFAYVAAVESLAAIVHRLRDRVLRIAEQGSYAVVGHSLGGVLLRAALKDLPAGTARPAGLFLLGSPISASRMARRLGPSFLFRALAGECGQLLGSKERMAQLGTSADPVTAVIGVRGVTGRRSPFGEEANDSMVAVSEASAPWLTRKIEIPVIHTLLPASSKTARIIVDDLACYHRF